jgi:hypothetical protein
MIQRRQLGGDLFRPAPGNFRTDDSDFRERSVKSLQKLVYAQNQSGLAGLPRAQQDDYWGVPQRVLDRRGSGAG